MCTCFNSVAVSTYELLISNLLKYLHSKDFSAIETDVLYDGHHGDVTTLLQSILFHEI